MRVAIVNDVALAAEALRRVVLAVPGLEVAWVARDGVECVEKAARDRPDVILMDLLMPRMNGVEATRQVMARSPCAILVVTATVSGHIGMVYEAMGHGALDAVDTPCLGPGGQVSGAAALVQKLCTIGKLLGEVVGSQTTPPAAVPPPPRQALTLVLLGASTGGPRALREILLGLAVDSPLSVVIVQHIDPGFAPGLASWLSEASRLPVELVREGQPPAPGRVHLAATSHHLVMDERTHLVYSPEPQDACYRPSVDVFFRSVAQHWQQPGVAALLTGMGCDGAAGLLQLRQRGWHTIAQDQATCVVWGMPRAAAALGAAVQVLPVEQIAAAISSRCPTV